MMREVAIACAMVLAVTANAFAKDPNAKVVFCVQDAKGAWSLHRFKPLIDAQGGTVFAEMGFEGGVMDELRLRRFYPDSELTFDYSFDANGRLVALRGGVQVRSVAPGGQKLAAGFEMADWIGEADLMPGADGKIPPHHVLYTREQDKIDKPENADAYIARFNDAPIYRTIQSVPCAAMMKEAEKMNATQE